jgi:hypothetical protein
MDAAAIDRLDDRRRDIDAEDAASLRREDRRGREADIAEAEDAEGGHLYRGKEDTRVSSMEY